MPCSPPMPAGSWALSAVAVGAPRNSGCETSIPESTIVTGIPGRRRRECVDADLRLATTRRPERVGEVLRRGDAVRSARLLRERHCAAGLERGEERRPRRGAARRQSRSSASIGVRTGLDEADGLRCTPQRGGAGRASRRRPRQPASSEREARGGSDGEGEEAGGEGHVEGIRDRRGAGCECVDSRLRPGYVQE